MSLDPLQMSNKWIVGSEMVPTFYLWSRASSTLLTLIYLGSYYFIICLTFSHLQVQNKLLFNPVASPLLPTPAHTYSHFTPALLTVCVKWGCRYFRVSMASLLRRESPLSFPPWPRSLSPHANTVDKASFCCWESLWRPIDGPLRGGGLSRRRPGCYHNMMARSLSSCFYLPGKINLWRTGYPSLS